MGGVVKEYQVVIHPQRLGAVWISLAEVKSALDASNQEVGGLSIELGGSGILWRAPAAIWSRSTTLITSF